MRQLRHNTQKPTKSHQSLPSPCVILKAIYAGVHLGLACKTMLVYANFYRSVQLARNRLKYIFSWCEFKFEDNHKSFQDILLDLAKYQDDDVVQTALHLLMQLYADEATLFSKAKQTQLLCTEQSMNEYKRVEKDLPTLQHHMSLETDESNEMVQILRGFTKMCVWDEEEQEPNQQNQTLLCNFGRFLQCMKKMKIQSESSESQSDTFTMYVLSHWSSHFGAENIVNREIFT